MKRTLFVVTMLPLLLAAVSCGDGRRSAAGPTATPSPAAIVGPLLVYRTESELVAYDAGARREVHRTALALGVPAQLPPGEREVIVAVTAGGVTTLRALDPATGATRDIISLRGAHDDAMLSPDGNMVAFTRGPTGSQEEPQQIVVAPVAGGQERVLATLPRAGDPFRGPAAIARWRDDGRGVLVWGVVGGPPGSWADVMLDGSVSPEILDYASPAPSGRAVLISGVNADSGCILDAVQRLRIWDFDAGAVAAEVDDPGRGIIVGDWSPDGSALLYEQYRTTPSADGCLPDYDLSSARWYLLDVHGGPPTTVPDVAALQRSWNRGHDITYPCAEGHAPDAWGNCTDDLPGLSVDGTTVESPGEHWILGWIDVPRADPPGVSQ